MATTITAAEAKAAFAECVRKAEAGEAVVITRHGREVVAIVKADRLRQLERLGAASPSEGLASLAGGWRGSDELRRLLGRPRSRPRRALPRGR